MLAAISPSCRQRKVDIEDQTHLDTNWTSRLTVEAFRLRWYYNHCSMLIVKKRICVCLLQGGKGSQHHSKGQQSLYFQYGGGWICFWFQHREHYFCFRKKWNECSDSVHFRWVFWWLVRTFTLTGSGRFAMPLLPLLPDERRLGRYGKTSKIWTQDHFTKAISASPGYVCVCVFCVHRYSWSKWFLAHKWSRWSTAWQRSGGGWGSSMLRSLQTYWAAAQLNWVQAADAGLYNTALGQAPAPFEIWLFLRSHQEDARSIRMLCQPRGHEWRVWSWCYRHMPTTKSAPSGARSWPGWRMWLQLQHGVFSSSVFFVWFFFTV